MNTLLQPESITDYAHGIPVTEGERYASEQSPPTPITEYAARRGE